MALTDFLTQIANSIRSKDGTTEPILATDFPQRILDIPSGGVSSDIRLATGTFTQSADVMNVEIEHGLSAMPNFSIVFAIVDSALGGNGYITINCCVNADIQSYIRVRGSWGNVSYAMKFGEVSDTYGESTVIFNNTGSHKTDKFVAGTTYRWIVGRAE